MDGALVNSAVQRLWGKLSADGEHWLPLVTHLTDTAETAALIWDEWVPLHVRRTVEKDFRETGLNDEESSDYARKVFRFLAASHDIGKASPIFQSKALRIGNHAYDFILTGLRQCGLSFPDHKTSSNIKHPFESEAILEDAGVPRCYACVVGGHHGKPVGRSQDIRHIINWDIESGIGLQYWNQIHEKLIQLALKAAGLEELPETPIKITTQVIFSGLLIMADWIASGEGFPLISCSEWTVLEDSETRARRAWKNLRLPPYRQFSDSCLPEELFQRRFHISEPRPMQCEAVKVALEMENPGIVVIEAPMGEGKTEAALAVSEILADKFGMGGIYFALPTQATSDGIFKRIETWIHTLRNKGVQSVLLAHGKAGLNKDYEGIRLKSNVNQYDGDASGRSVFKDDLVIVNEWTQGRKKGLLSDFVIGTVDQILMCGLKQKHLALRHLGVANKVVIIDECHAYDTYMSSYLALVLQWLGAYQVPVVLLSATLPSGRRDFLVQAYLTYWGCQSKSGTQEIPEPKYINNIHYPLITYTDGWSRKQVFPDTSGSTRQVQVIMLQNEQLTQTLEKLLAKGGCVGVICNTVGKAQVTAAALAARFGAEHVKLLHSRFLACERAAKELQVRSSLGPAFDQQDSKRPEMMIVVGTQVMEQSLDVDFDALVTDLCPMDLLLQRIGRLHRHCRNRPRPESMRYPQCFVMGAVNGAEFETGSETVYGKYLLLKSMAFLPERIAIPDDMPRLVAKTYGDEETDGQALSNLQVLLPDMDIRKVYMESLQKYKKVQQSKEQRAEMFQIMEPENQGGDLVGWLNAGMLDSSEKRGEATVRDAEDSIEVLCVVCKKDGYMYTMPCLQACPALSNKRIVMPDEELARMIASCSVALPAKLTKPYAIDQTIWDLEQGMVEHSLDEWYESHWLNGELFLVFDEDGYANVGEIILKYDPQYGLQIVKEA